MTTEIQTYTAAAEQALCKPKNRNYEINLGSKLATLHRDEDFGVIPGTKAPCLYKAGAEKIAMLYGLLQQYEVVSKIESVEDPDKPFFYYMVKCKLVKVVNGVEYVFASGYGSANTKEKRNGRNSAYDAANACVKMSQKRALVSAAISISALSGMFTQDLENESFMSKSELIVKETPESPITPQQIKRLFAVAGDSGLTQAEAKKVIADLGFASTKSIPQKSYNEVIDCLRQAASKE